MNYFPGSRFQGRLRHTRIKSQFHLLSTILFATDFLILVLIKNTVLSWVVSIAMTEYHRLDDL